MKGGWEKVRHGFIKQGKSMHLYRLNERDRHLPDVERCWMSEIKRDRLQYVLKLNVSYFLNLSIVLIKLRVLLRKCCV